MEKVACYIRVSTEEQKLHGISLDAQIDKLTEYAQKHNLKIVEWYKDEGVSGRKLIKNRPELQRMLFDAQEKKFDRILFIKLDRFFRSVAEYHECMKMIDPVVWTATEEKYDLSTANGRAFVNMKLTIAELEADQTGERIKIVNDYKVKTGQAICGSIPFGYKIVSDGKSKRVVKDEEQAEALKDVINHFLLYQSKRSSLNHLGEKYGYQMPRSSFDKLLKNPLLYGRYRDNDSYIEDPIIDKGTFEKIQAVLSNNIKKPQSNRSYLFTGLLICPGCGRKLSSTSHKQHWYHKGTDQVRYGYSIGYVCGLHDASFKCSFAKYVSESKIEKMLLNSFNDFINSKIKVISVERKSEIDDEKAAQAKIESLKRDMDKLKHLYMRDDISESQYDKEMDKLRSELQELSAPKKNDDKKDLEKYKAIIESGWINIYLALNKENRRAFWRKFIKEIHIDDNINITEIVFN